MKTAMIYGLALWGAMACTRPAKYVPEPCGQPEAVQQSDKLQLGDTLPGFSSVGKEERSFYELKGKELLVFFKTQEALDFCMLNDEIKYKNIGALARRKNVNIIALYEYKVAGVYGIDLDYKGLTDSYLFWGDQDQVIRKIYKHVCEEDIIRMLNALPLPADEKGLDRVSNNKVTDR